MPRVYDPQLRGFNKSVVQIMGLLMEKKKSLSIYMCVTCFGNQHVCCMCQYHCCGICLQCSQIATEKTTSALVKPQAPC